MLPYVKRHSSHSTSAVGRAFTAPQKSYRTLSSQDRALVTPVPTGGGAENVLDSMQLQGVVDGPPKRFWTSK
ncbi:hypothetical protein KIN20_037093 [Parelaphostrongylus tenuis]|uniref:Uncharacterized protein n=1 Tax=Parelaphostrongylus tenuis TaxID=148309 RepID=A0AAD5RDS4_PARTN|nr:hypothetical protein KIN20_037093 [Parelaphostrongylus tenuis]